MNTQNIPLREIKEGETINDYTFQYGVSKRVLEIYGDYLKYRNIAYLDGMGTFDAQEDVKALKLLIRAGILH